MKQKSYIIPDVGKFFEGVESSVYFLENRTNVRNYRTNLKYYNKIFCMMEKLLGNKIKPRVAMFFVENEGEYQVSDLARILRISKSRASECLRELEKIGFLKSRTVGRSKLYSLADNKLAKMLKKALLIDKALLEEIEKELVHELRKLKPISIALYGSTIREMKKESDIGIAMILDRKDNVESLSSVASKIDAEYGILVSILPLEIKELRKRLEKGDEFAINLLTNHKLLYGKKLKDLLIKTRRSTNRTKGRIGYA